MFLCEKKKKKTAVKLPKTNIGQGSQQNKRYWVCQNIQYIHVPKRGKNTSKLFSICKHILWIFPEDEFVSFKNRIPKYLIKRTSWNRAKEEKIIFILSITKSFHHHHPGLLMCWIKCMRPLLCGKSPFKTHTLFIQIYEQREGNGNNAFHSILNFWSLVHFCFNTRFLVWMTGLYSQSHEETWRKAYEFQFWLCVSSIHETKILPISGWNYLFYLLEFGAQFVKCCVWGSLSAFLSFLLFFLPLFLTLLLHLEK